MKCTFEKVGKRVSLSFVWGGGWLIPLRGGGSQIAYY
jgi:hypothetical protein